MAYRGMKLDVGITSACDGDGSMPAVLVHCPVIATSRDARDKQPCRSSPLFHPAVHTAVTSFTFSVPTSPLLLPLLRYYFSSYYFEVFGVCQT